jgi:hypothetical protein
MSGTRFKIREIWDLQGRGGLLATGLLSGEGISKETVLKDRSGARVVVLGFELHAPQGMHTLILERESAAHLRAGDVLEKVG